MNIAEMRAIIGECDVSKCWGDPLRVEIVNYLYLQVVCDGTCTMTGEPMTWKGRKWLLSKHMTRTEIVATVFKAVLTAVEHEVRELFTYRGAAIYDSHINVEQLRWARSKPLDGRD